MINLPQDAHNALVSELNEAIDRASYKIPVVHDLIQELTSLGWSLANGEHDHDTEVALIREVARLNEHLAWVLLKLQEAGAERMQGLADSWASELVKDQLILKCPTCEEENPGFLHVAQGCPDRAEDDPPEAEHP